MDGVTVKVDGLDDLKRRMEQLNQKLASRVLDRGLAAGARLVRNAAKQKAPVDTGLLRRAIRYGKVRQLSYPGHAVYHVYVSPKVKGKKGWWPFYWIFHEFGTSKMAARPFMRPAIDESKGAVLQAIKMAWEAELTRYGG